MKKLTLATTLALLSPFAAADTILGVYAGAGQWQGEYSGNAGDPSIDVKSLGMDEEDNNYYYIALEHPVPIIPNIKLQKMDITSEQTAVIDQTFTIDGTTFVAGTEVASDFDLSHMDIVLYYELLDNWVNLDVGLSIRKFDGHVTAVSEFTTESVELDEAIPMIYAKAQFDLPLTGFSVGLEGNAINYEDNRLTDYSAKLQYMFDSALDIGLEVGYREMSLEVDEDVTADIQLKGPYAALLFHF
ncbi:MAG TPA: TIGR04219 family outer membrane beta-barrel protein [Cellvibrio sp.]|nr:TIGR04219 family outer membrane beta-barrel protein [Cellvibrio sp.]